MPHLPKLPLCPLLLAQLLMLNACHTRSDRSQELARTQTKYEHLQCTWAADSSGKLKSFDVKALLQLGPSPQPVALPNEKIADKTELNPSSETADTFVRAASGVRLIRQGKSDTLTLAVAQDSRRKVALAHYKITLADLVKDPFAAKTLGMPDISMVAVDLADAIAKYDDDGRDYVSFRKGNKRDFEAMTTLLNGDTLIVSSGSDMNSAKAGKPSFRNQALILSPSGQLKESYDLLPFYLLLNENRAIVGNDKENLAAGLNIEGVAIRSGARGTSINFFHRGNVNSNGHNAVIEFEYNSWFAALKASQGLSAAAASAKWRDILPLRVVSIELPTVVSLVDPSAKAFPITINDALYGFNKGQELFIIPAGVEAEFVDKTGAHHDGEVTFAGLLVWSDLGNANGGRCEIYQAPGDDKPGMMSKFGKIEGLAAYSPDGRDFFSQSLFSEKALLFGVTDVDSELSSSRLSIIKVKP